MFSSEGSATQEYLYECMWGVVYRGINNLPVATPLEKRSVPTPTTINLPIAPQGEAGPLEPHPDP